jgi:hypothetical protein
MVCSGSLRVNKETIKVTKIYKFTLAVTVLLLMITAAFAQQAVTSDRPTATPIPLTNDSIVKLAKSGLSEELIVNMVNTQAGDYKLGADDVLQLKKEGVTDRVLSAMLHKASGAPSATVPLTAGRSVSTLPDGHSEAARTAIRSLRRVAGAVDRSASDRRGANVGISYETYSQLVAEVRAEVEDALHHMWESNLKSSIQASLNEYTYAADVYRKEQGVVGGQLKDIAVQKYGVKKHGLLKLVWLTDFLNAIWLEGRNQLEVANTIQSQAQSTNEDNTKEIADRFGRLLSEKLQLPQLPRDQTIAFAGLADHQIDSISVTEYKGQRYATFSLNGLHEYNSIQLGQAARAARVIQDSFVSRLKLGYYLKEIPNLNGIRIDMEIPYRDFVNEHVSHHDSLTLYSAFEDLKKFADADITSQELIDRSTVLINNNRVKVSLDTAK